MTDTITPASLRAHADWFDATFEPGSVEARSLRNCAARLEAESARETSVETLARALAENFTDSTRWDWLTVSRAAHAFFAADGRLLPEGGTEEAAQDCEEMCEDNHDGLVCTRLAGHPGRHVAHNEQDQPLHAWPATPPAVPVPDDAPDGTPEKPWPTWQDVPEGVKYRGADMSGPVFVNRVGKRITEWQPGVEFANTHQDWMVQDFAPFVRVDGDK